MRPVSLASTGLLASTAAWTALSAWTAPRPDAALIMMAASLWMATVAAVTGMLVARARWARRLGMTVSAGHGALAVLIVPSPWWGAAVTLSALTAVGLGGPWLDGYVRGRPSASGPPTRAVLLPLTLLGVPFLLGLFGAENAAAMVVAATAVAAAFWFIRTLPATLVVVRAVWPALALGLAPWLGWPAGAVAGAAAVTVVLLAWHPSVRNSVHPLVERGSRLPIPPELAPGEVLDAADIDDRGRPR